MKSPLGKIIVLPIVLVLILVLFASPKSEVRVGAIGGKAQVVPDKAVLNEYKAYQTSNIEPAVSPLAYVDGKSANVAIGRQNSINKLSLIPHNQQDINTSQKTKNIPIPMIMTIMAGVSLICFIFLLFKVVLIRVYGV